MEDIDALNSVQTTVSDHALLSFKDIFGQSLCWYDSFSLIWSHKKVYFTFDRHRIAPCFMWPWFTDIWQKYSGKTVLVLVQIQTYDMEVLIGGGYYSHLYMYNIHSPPYVVDADS